MLRPNMENVALRKGNVAQGHSNALPHRESNNGDYQPYEF